MKKSKNSFGIRFLTKGPPGLIAVLNEIIAALDALRVQRSVDIDSAVAPEGTLLTIRNPTTGGRRPTEPARTMLVYDASDEEGAKIGVTYGQINNRTPTLGGTELGGDTPPTLPVVSGVVYLHTTVDVDGVQTALIIENAATVPDATKTNGYLVLAEITVEDDVITSLEPSAWNVFQMGKCGATTYQWGGFGA